MKKKYNWTRLLFSAAAVVLLTVGTILWAAKPAEKEAGNPNEPTPELLPGTIYFSVINYASDLADTCFQVYGMRSDGSDIFPALPAGYGGYPSHRLYGGENDPHRWWLSIEDLGLGEYMDSQGVVHKLHRFELFAFRVDSNSPTGVAAIQLTNFHPLVKIGSGVIYRPEWSNDGLDSYIGLKGYDFSVYPEENKTVLYRLNLSATDIELAFNAGVDPVITAKSPLTEVTTSTEFDLAGSYTQHDWAPPVAGDQVVYQLRPDPFGDRGLYISDIVTRQIRLAVVVNSFNHPFGIRWSPDGTQLVWGDSRDIGIVNADGSGQRLLLDGKLGNAFQYPFWSLAGDHVLCKVRRYFSHKKGHCHETFMLTSIADGISFDIPTPFDDQTTAETGKGLIDWVSDNLAPLPSARKKIPPMGLQRSGNRSTCKLCTQILAKPAAYKVNEKPFRLVEN